MRCPRMSSVPNYQVTIYITMVIPTVISQRCLYFGRIERGRCQVPSIHPSIHPYTSGGVSPSIDPSTTGERPSKPESTSHPLVPRLARPTDPALGAKSFFHSPNCLGIPQPVGQLSGKRLVGGWVIDRLRFGRALVRHQDLSPWGEASGSNHEATPSTWPPTVGLTRSID